MRGLFRIVGVRAGRQMPGSHAKCREQARGFAAKIGLASQIVEYGRARATCDQLGRCIVQHASIKFCEPVVDRKRRFGATGLAKPPGIIEERRRADDAG